MNSGSEMHSQLQGVVPRKRMLSSITILAVILVMATALRVLSALYQGNEVAPLPGIHDQISYDGLARRVVAGHGFSFAEGHWPATRGGEPTAHWSYLYTLYLAAVYSVFGPYPVVARLIQAVVSGILHGWLAWRLGDRVFGPRTGLIAAALSAVYIYFFYYAGGLVTETFYFLGILWTLNVAMKLVEKGGSIDASREQNRPNWPQWLELGLAIGVTVLLRQLFLLFVPLLFLWLWWNLPEGQTQRVHRGVIHRLRWPVLAGLATSTVVVVMLILPWTLRNYRAFGTFVPLNTNSGFAFYWGNHPIHGTRFMPLLPDGERMYLALIPEELLPLNEAELDKALLSLGLKFVTDDPMRFLLLSLSRAEEYFKFWPSAGSGLVSNVSRVASFGLFLPFMLYGAGLAMIRIKKPEFHGQPAAILLLLLFVVTYTAIHLMVWTLIRYRLPIDIVLVLFAAYGLNSLAVQLKLSKRLVGPGQRRVALAGEASVK